MIRCLRDSLVFAFENAARELRDCATSYIAEWLPPITAVAPSEIVEELLRKQTWLPSEEKEKARKRAASITREQIADKFADLVSAEITCHEPDLSINFQRTLRLPDDDKTYPLPPGLGSFPLRRIERYQRTLPDEWSRRGGVLMPMYQAEAMWLHFSSGFPVALKVGTGLINAVNGQPWNAGLDREPQGYLVLPEQPWLDGYCAGPGVIRQFVAARLGRGYTAEEQLYGTGQGGIQLEAFTLKPDRYFAKQLRDELPRDGEEVIAAILSLGGYRVGLDHMLYCCEAPAVGMGLGAGGKMKQEIYKDPWETDDWDLGSPLRVWVHICDALRWHQITGELPPQKPITAKDYSRAGLPWFDYYRDDVDAIEGSSVLGKLKSVFAAAKDNDDDSVPQEESVTIGNVKAVGPHAPVNTVSGWDGN